MSWLYLLVIWQIPALQCPKKRALIGYIYTFCSGPGRIVLNQEAFSECSLHGAASSLIKLKRGNSMFQKFSTYFISMKKTLITLVCMTILAMAPAVEAGFNPAAKAKAKAEALAKEAHNKAEAARKKAAAEAHKRAEAARKAKERAAALARKQAEEARKRAEAARKKAAEKARKKVEAIRKAKAEAEALARQKAEEARRKAEEARQKAEELARLLAEQAQQIVESVKDLVEDVAENIQSSAEDAILIGTWYAPGYGNIFVIGEKYAYQMNQTSSFCAEGRAKLDRYSFDLTVQVDESGQSFTKDDVQYKKLNVLPMRCLPGIRVPLYEQEDQKPYVAELYFDIFWETINDYYAGFGWRDAEWQEQYDFYRSKASSAQGYQALNEIYRDIVLSVDDIGLNIQFGEALNTDDRENLQDNTLHFIIDEFLVNNPGFAGSSDDFIRNTEAFIDYQASYVSQTKSRYESMTETYFVGGELTAKSAVYGLEWARLPGNLAYLKLGGVSLNSSYPSGPSADSVLIQALNQTLDKILLDFDNAQGLVLDLRFNRSGFTKENIEAVNFAIASRFINSDYIAYTSQLRDRNKLMPMQSISLEPIEHTKFLNPVVVLTSNLTKNDAERLALTMRSNDRVTLIGERTAGYLSPVEAKLLPDYRQLSLPNQRILSPQGEAFEGVGIPVDVSVPVLLHDVDGTQSDLSLEAAMEQLH